MLRIGISACYFHADPKRAVFKDKSLLYLEESMGRWLMSEAGVIGYLIPADAAGRPYVLNDVVADLDGLLLQGGSDVAPGTYGETPLKPEWGGDAVRDGYEIALTRAFAAAGKPVLGVCRGLQLLNVAYGGTLYQDIGTQVPGAHVHRDWEIYDRNAHEIEFAPGSAMGQGRACVNSVHHQAVKALGKGLRAEAWSVEAPGVARLVEALRLEGAGAPWVAGVQWHPEFHTEEDIRGGLLDGRPLLREFLAACRAAKKGDRAC